MTAVFHQGLGRVTAKKILRISFTYKKNKTKKALLNYIKLKTGQRQHMKC